MNEQTINAGKPTRAREGRFLTIGYQGRTLDEFLDCLRMAQVDVLVDVRENAVSRKRGFSRKALAAAAESIGVEYRHQPLLGNPKSNREAFRSGSQAAREFFVKHLNNGSRTSYDTVVELARTKAVALVCFEREHDECHRSCITSQAQSENSSLIVERL